jgi:hypothetical protein
MTTITEDYISFEAAKLLKEKGFPQSTFRCHYITDGNSHYKSFENRCGFGDYDIIAPTLAMVMKWLREVHKAFISITYENDGAFTANLKVPLKEVDCMIDNKHNCWFTYEEAAEEAIKFCLENVI